MRALDLAPFAFAIGLLVPAAHAAETPRDIKGLYLMTDYPAVTVQPGTTSNIPLRLQNYDSGRSERAGRIAAALARVRLVDVAEKRVATFSRGMRQRLGLAEIIVKRAEIAILDEPTSGLDPQAMLEFLGLIDELKAEGVTVLLSSHLLEQVQRICNRVALFQAGRIVLMGAVADLARQVLGAGFLVEVEADGAGLSRRLATIPGVTNVETLAEDRFRMTADRDVRPDAARAVVAANGSLRRLSVDEPSLEAIYARYFQNHSAPTGGTRHAA